MGDGGAVCARQAAARERGCGTGPVGAPGARDDARLGQRFCRGAYVAVQLPGRGAVGRVQSWRPSPMWWRMRSITTRRCFCAGAAASSLTVEEVPARACSGSSEGNPWRSGRCRRHRTARALPAVRFSRAQQEQMSAAARAWPNVLRRAYASFATADRAYQVERPLEGSALILERACSTRITRRSPSGDARSASARARHIRARLPRLRRGEDDPLRLRQAAPRPDTSGAARCSRRRVCGGDRWCRAGRPPPDCLRLGIRGGVAILDDPVTPSQPLPFRTTSAPNGPPPRRVSSATLSRAEASVVVEHDSTCTDARASCA